MSYIIEIRPIMQQLHVLTSEMVHFIHQIQYYILFEVLECSWAALIEQVNKAESLDDVLSAHQEFLKTIHADSMYSSGPGNVSLIIYAYMIKFVIILFLFNFFFIDFVDIIYAHSRTSAPTNRNI